ncbi:MAG: transposase [Alphaproteobacteria bacterium]|nr:transposase [Alphaproteobacteria bacterium]
MSDVAWFCDEVCPCIGRIVVVNPGQFQVIRQSVKKTDHNDAHTSAFFLFKDMLPETHLKSVAEAELVSLVQTHDSFVRSCALLLNRIHALYNRRGTKFKKEGLASQKKLFALDSSQFTLLECVDLDALREQTLNPTIALTKLDSAIKAATGKMDGFDKLTRIKSIGIVSSFASTDKFAACIRIVPRIKPTIGERITKRGNKLIRTTLVQCTLIAIRYSDCLNSFYRHFKEHRGLGKTIIATA